LSYAKLCAADGNGQCSLPTKVVIEENLIYDQIQRTGAEYEVDTIRTVELKIGLDKPVYYEYIRPPCVELAFYEGGKKQSKGGYQDFFLWVEQVIYFILNISIYQFTCSKGKFGVI